MISLAHLTVLSLAPPEMIGVASRTGYDAVGLRLIAVTPTTPGYPLMNGPAMLRETKARMADTGVRVLDIEFLRLTPETDVAALEPFMATGAELGARHVLTAPYDPDFGRLADTLAGVSDLAGRYGMSAVLEFFPWTDVNSLGSARRIVDATNRPNCGILVDTLHFDRSDSTLAELAATPAPLLPFVHLCDCPAEKPATLEGLLHNGRAERLPPGEGEIGLPGILDAMPADIPVALEVPMERLTREIGPEGVARRAREGARRLLARAEGRPVSGAFVSGPSVSGPSAAISAPRPGSRHESA